MWIAKRLCICLLACLLWLAAGTSSRAEMMYQISETELTQLETDLNQLKKNNETKQNLLTEQKAQLTEANQQLEMVKKQLIESKTLNDQTLKSLENANQSLKQLEDEAKKDIETKTRQRNLWIAISGGLLYALSKK